MVTAEAEDTSGSTQPGYDRYSSRAAHLAGILGNGRGPLRLRSSRRCRGSHWPCSRWNGRRRWVAASTAAHPRGRVTVAFHLAALAAAP